MPTVARPRGRPVRVKVQLDLLPGAQHRVEHPSHMIEPEGQRRHGIDEEAGLQPVLRQPRELIADPDARRLDRAAVDLVAFVPGLMVSPGELGVDGEESVSHGGSV